ncbi:MAG: DUF2231 domain-containing protein [Pseudomonadota bacterium]
MIEIIPNWHPILVHFTVALFTLAAGLFVVTPFIKSSVLKEQWQIVARWNLWFSAGITLVTGLTGLYAYNTVTHDVPSHAAMTEHRNWAIVAATLILTLAVWSIVRVRRNRALGVAFSVAMAAAGGVLAATAWHGSEVVFRYGLGVKSLPKAEGEGHAHQHAGGAGHGAEQDAHPGVSVDHHDDHGATPALTPQANDQAHQATKKSPPKAVDHPHDDGHRHEH